MSESRPDKQRRRDAGALRQLPSGRWQARVRDPATHKLVPIGTFETKTEAQNEIEDARSNQRRGGWVDPRRGQIPFATYAATWIEDHPKLSDRTRRNYESYVRNHVTFGAANIGEIDLGTIRRWHAQMTKKGAPASAARVYRFVAAVFNAAAKEERIVRSPCRIDGAGRERSPERPIASVPEVYALAEAVEPRCRLLVLLGAFCALRAGELFALRRRDLDLSGKVRVDETLYWRGGEAVLGPPKTDAGYRKVGIPDIIAGDVRDHLAEFAGPGPDGFVFTRPGGAAMSHSYWRRRWERARDSLGLSHLAFHDLRHTGNTLAAATGASTKELMARMGHNSSAAALRYQHATEEREAEITEALSRRLTRLAEVVPLDERRKSHGG